MVTSLLLQCLCEETKVLCRITSEDGSIDQDKFDCENDCGDCASDMTCVMEDETSGSLYYHYCE